MTDPVRVLVALALIGVVAVFVIAFVRSILGKSVRGTLRVPQGKNRVDVQVRDDSKLRPYRFDQTFDVEVVPGEGYGMGLRYRGAIVGVVDGSNTYALALSKLAGMHSRVLVPATILSLDEQRRPLIQLLLPNTSWFKRALS